MRLLEPTPTVLIVDDHPSLRAVARRVLETDGFALVGTASDGESGFAEALRLEPDVVLLDVELPDIDGFEVAARLRGQLGRCDRPRVDQGRSRLRPARRRIRGARLRCQGGAHRRRHPRSRRVILDAVILGCP
jgi:CheY-like chemotaxis protein